MVKFADTQKDKEQRRLQQQLAQQMQQLNTATWGNLTGLGGPTPQYLAVSSCGWGTWGPQGEREPRPGTLPDSLFPQYTKSSASGCCECQEILGLSAVSPGEIDEHKDGPFCLARWRLTWAPQGWVLTSVPASTSALGGVQHAPHTVI